jgi:hypothetical protein
MDRPTTGTDRGGVPIMERLETYVRNLDPSKREDVVRMLQYPDRWTVLSVLAGRESVPLHELATALKRRRAVGEEPSDTQVEARLYHVDLPALADAELVDWDTETRTARLRAGGRELVGAPPKSTPLDD